VRKRKKENIGSYLSGIVELLEGRRGLAEDPVAERSEVTTSFVINGSTLPKKEEEDERK
jgi:hypothetical protein